MSPACMCHLFVYVSLQWPRHLFVCAWLVWARQSHFHVPFVCRSHDRMQRGELPEWYVRSLDRCCLACAFSALRSFTCRVASRLRVSMTLSLSLACSSRHAIFAFSADFDGDASTDPGVGAEMRFLARLCSPVSRPRSSRLRASSSALVLFLWMICLGGVCPNKQRLLNHWRLIGDDIFTTITS